SENRARPHPSCVGARARTNGSPRLPVGPVTKTLTRLTPANLPGGHWTTRRPETAGLHWRDTLQSKEEPHGRDPASESCRCREPGGRATSPQATADRRLPSLLQVRVRRRCGGAHHGPRPRTPRPFLGQPL